MTTLCNPLTPSFSPFLPLSLPPSLPLARSHSARAGWLGWLSGVSDNALYPILFLDCLIQLFSGAHDGDDDSRLDTSFFGRMASDNDSHIRWTFIVSITLVLTYLSYRGLDVVGNVAIVVCLLSLMPFLVFCLLGSFKVDPARWLVAPPGGWRGVDWRLLLNTFFWNINFWESAAVSVLYGL